MSIKYVQLLILATFILAFSLGFFLNWGIMPIGKMNDLKENSEKKFQDKKYKEAILSLKDLLNIAPETDEAQLNLGHSFFSLKDTISKVEYAKNLMSDDVFVKSISNQQLGVFWAQYLKDNPASKNGKQMLDDAIAYCKESLRANPNNAQSRYNFELLSRLKAANQQNQEEQKQEEKDKENKENQEKKEEKDQNKQDESQDKNGQGKQEEQDGKKTESASDKMEKKPMNKDAAKMLLNAMKNSEMQYLQQLKRKTDKPLDKSLPDW